MVHGREKRQGEPLCTYGLIKLHTIHPDPGSTETEQTIDMTDNANPAVSVVMPVYNAERYVATAMESVLVQSLSDFELLVVNDGSQDNSVKICQSLADRRTRILHQSNCGVSSARNTGIAHARAGIIALLDSDDMWAPEKLDRHVAHLRSRPHVGISYSGSKLIDEAGRPLGIYQRPVLHGVTPGDVFCGRVIRNGSVPVFRREVLDEIGQRAPDGERLCYFDESFRQSEDVECWTRIALTSRWTFEGLPGELTSYRVNSLGLSADVDRQLETWERAYAKVATYAPDFIASHGPEARARELRYLARRAFTKRDRELALRLALEALRTWPRLMRDEPVKTSVTLAACALLRIVSEHSLDRLPRTLRRLHWER
jgi:glycosyltransferase involved in cell wall biosynthesis